MQALIKKRNIVITAPRITFGIYDEPFEKWRIADENNNLMYYMIDGGYELVKDVELPSDYENGKYFYENGGFILNPEWKPYISTEQKIENLEQETSLVQNSLYEQQTISESLGDELISTQIALVDQYEINIALEEQLISAQEEILDLQLAICDLYEALLV